MLKKNNYVRNAKIGLYLIFFFFLFLLVYSIFRAKVKDQWDVTGHGHTVTWSYAMMENDRRF